jgi:hypothetical protein
VLAGEFGRQRPPHAACVLKVLLKRRCHPPLNVRLLPALSRGGACSVSPARSGNVHVLPPTTI